MRMSIDRLLKAELLSAAASAADRIVVDEADTRVLIDAQLAAAGWEADTLRLRYSRGTRPDRRRAMAIAEWPTETGPADYALFKEGRSNAISRVNSAREGERAP